MNNNMKGCTDCFAHKGNRCSILTEMLGLSKKCHFYKTQRQFWSDLRKYPPPEGSEMAAILKRREKQCALHRTHRIEASK